MGPFVDGSVDSRFTPLARAFEATLCTEGELGMSLCVTLHGQVVVDCFGGLAEPSSGRRWERDTICVAWSCVKGATALCAHLLSDRGVIELDAPVATYWPEFAAAGKEAITVRMLLNHQAGLLALRERVPRAGLLDWERTTQALAREAPFWEPGTQHGYHVLTFGFLVGEVVRRASGRRISEFFRAEIAAPLGLDFWMSLPENEEERVVKAVLAPASPGEPLSSFTKALFVPGSLQAHVLNCGDIFAPEIYDSRAAHAAELPSSGGITNARGLAGLYQPLACRGRFGERGLISEQAIVEMSRVSSAGKDACSLVPTRFALGFQKRMDNRREEPGDRGEFLIPETAFGHMGIGGSVGFADPATGLSFGFVTNRGCRAGLLDRRAQSLIDTTYACLGARDPRAASLPPE